MKKYILSISFLLYSLITILAQAKPVKIMFEVTSNDTLTHQTTLRHVSGMSSANPKSEFEGVVYGGALLMIMKAQSTVIKGIKELENNKNVSFKICSATMKRHNVDQSQLLSSIGVVLDAIVKIVTKRKKMGYIMESHN